MKLSALHIASASAAMILMCHSAANAAVLSFSSGVASFEQSFDGAWTAAKAIDGLIPATGVPSSGWAIFDLSTSTTASQSALFTLQTPLAAGAYTLIYTLTQAYGTNHTLDTFSLAYTTAAGPVLASIQTLVNISSAISSGGATLSLPVTGNVDASGPLPATDVYTIVASINSATPVTGLFLNVIDIAGAGPGRQSNGNFVLTEFAVDVSPVPEPAQWALLAAGMAALRFAVKRRKS